MRSLGSETTTETSAPVTRPGFLLEFSITPVIYLSSRGNIGWNGESWVGYDFQVGGLSADTANPGSTGTITFGNADLTMSAYLLGQDVSGKRVRIWKFYGDVSALADPVLLFDGVADTATVNDDGRASLTLQQVGGRTLYCPRTYITPDAGFHWLPPQGKKIVWNGETIVLNPDGV